MNLKAIFFWSRVAFSFLTQSGRATMALSIMVVTAVSALIFLSAMAVGVNDAMLRNTVELFSGHIVGYDLPDTIGPEDLAVKGVKGVLKRVFLPGVLSHDDLGQSLMICGIMPDREQIFTALKKRIIAGNYPQNNRAEILISQLLAEALNAQTGTQLTFKPKFPSEVFRLTVSGIYQTHIENLDRGIAFMPLDSIGGKNGPWSTAVFLNTGVSPEKVIDVYQQKWPGRYRFESWSTLMPDLSQLIDLEYLSMGIVILLVFGVVAIGIACSFIIFIIKNMREYGIMKAMGVTDGEMFFVIVMKVVFMNAIASSIGLLLGCLITYVVSTAGGIDLTAFTSHNQYFSVSGVIYPRLTEFSLLGPPVTAFLFSLVAAVWPATLLSRKKTADILRMI